MVIAGLWLLCRPHASKGLEIYLVESTKGMPCGEMDWQILLRVGADGRVWINGEKVEMEMVRLRLEKAFESRSDRLVFVWPEENADFGLVTELIEAAHSKMGRVALLTSKVERDPGGCGPALMPPRRRVVPNPFVQSVRWW